MLKCDFQRIGRSRAIYRHLLAISCLCALYGACGGSAEQDGGQVITPDKAIQEQIDRTADAFYNRPRRASGLDRAMSELVKLEGLVGKDRPRLIQQLLFYEAHVAGGKSMMPLVILKFLDYSDPFVVEALAPYVNANDPKLRDLVSDRLKGVHRIEGPKGDPLRPPRYRTYERYMEYRVKKGEPIPLAFIAYMYDEAPDMALLALMDAHWSGGQYRKPAKAAKQKIEPVAWSEHIVATAIWRNEHDFQDKFQEVLPAAIRELEKLSKHETWWIRLYVAEILRQHPAFRTPELIARLAADDHPLIREAMSFATGKPTKAAKPPRPQLLP